MATKQAPLKISLESLGMTLSSAMPSFIWNDWEPKTLQNCAPDSLQKSFVFVSENGDGDSGSIVVLGKSSLDAIQTESLSTFEQIHQKSMTTDCQSIIAGLSSSKVEEKLTEVLQENVRMKEALEQNSLAMKQHLGALVSKQEELTKVHEAHRLKFSETKNLVNQLKLENNELKVKMQLQEEKINGKESKDESSQTEKEEEKVEPEIAKTSIDNEFAEEMLQLAEKSEEQAKEIAHLRSAIASLHRQLEPVYRNLFAGIKWGDVRSGSEPPEDSHGRHFLESFTLYNGKLEALGKCYVAQVSRYTSIQECLQRCSEILSEKEKAASTVADGESLESQKRKELQEHRSRLMDEELSTIVERQEMIQAQNEFQKIFTHYNSTVLELESLRREKERMSSLQRGASLHDERLDEAKASLRDSEKLLEQQRRALEQDRNEVLREKQALERERLRLQEEEGKLVEANASLNEEIERMRETNNLLEQQCTLYEEDFADERKLRENLITEKNLLIDEMRRLECRSRGFAQGDSMD